MRWLAWLGLASAAIGCAGGLEATRSGAASPEEPAAEASVTGASPAETAATANTNGGASGAGPAAPQVMTPDEATERLAEAGYGDAEAFRELMRSESGDPVPPAPSEPADVEGEDVRRLPQRSDVVAAIDLVLPAVRACSTGEIGAVTLELVLAGSTGRVLRTRAARSDLSPATVRCVRSAVAELRVPPFGAETFAFHYPFHVGE